MACDHPARDVTYTPTGDWDESAIGRCAACGHAWFASRREWQNSKSPLLIQMFQRRQSVFGVKNSLS